MANEKTIKATLVHKTSGDPSKNGELVINESTDGAILKTKIEGVEKIIVDQESRDEIANIKEQLGINAETGEGDTILSRLTQLEEIPVEKGIGASSIQQAQRTNKIVKVNGKKYFAISEEMAGHISEDDEHVIPNPDKTKPEDAFLLEYGAIGNYSAVLGADATAENLHAVAINNSTLARGEESFAQGYETVAEGNSSSAMGSRTWARGKASHAEGYLTQARGDFSHTEGQETYVELSAIAAHAEGRKSQAKASYTHAGGNMSVALSQNAFAHGFGNIAGGRGFRIIAQEPILSEEGKGKYTLSSTDGIKNLLDNLDEEETLNYSVRMFFGAYKTGKILEVNGNTITVDNFVDREYRDSKDINAPYEGDDFNKDSNPRNYNYLMIVGHPELGDMEVGFNALAFGENTIASDRSSAAFGSGTKALGWYSHAEGQLTTAGYCSHSEGRSTEALGEYSHAEGVWTQSQGDYTHTEGHYTHARGKAAHAEGYGNTNRPKKVDTVEELRAAWVEKKFHTADGQGSHIEGTSNVAYGNYSHAEGAETFAEGSNSHTEGAATYAIGSAAHAEGSGSTATSNYSHTEGLFTQTVIGENATSEAQAAHAEGYNTIASDEAAHAEGISTKARGKWSHAEGESTITKGISSHAEGAKTVARGNHSHAEGSSTTYVDTDFADFSALETAWKTNKFLQAFGTASHAEGQNNITGGSGSHAEGVQNIANAEAAHIEGALNIVKSQYGHGEGLQTEVIPKDGATNGGRAAHAEGYNTNATDEAAHAEGYSTNATGKWSHAEGNTTTASNIAAHAEGSGSQATGAYSHAEGQDSRAVGTGSHASGRHTIADADYMTAVGKYNIRNTNALFAVGCGESDTNRANCFTTGINASKEAYIKVGKTTLTEAQLIKILNFIDKIADDEEV